MYSTNHEDQTFPSNHRSQPNGSLGKWQKHCRRVRPNSDFIVLNAWTSLHLYLKQTSTVYSDSHWYCNYDESNVSEIWHENHARQTSTKSRIIKSLLELLPIKKLFSIFQENRLGSTFVASRIQCEKRNFSPGNSILQLLSTPVHKSRQDKKPAYFGNSQVHVVR